MNITIVGLGYVGFPLALQTASKGHTVFGLDKNEKLLELIKANKSPITPDEHINQYLGKVALDVSSNIKKSEIYIVCVPTPVYKKELPDLKYVKSAAEEIATVLKGGDLVIIESTIYPGVCTDIVQPILDKTGVKYHLAHCPERINPGDKKWNVSNIPRVVGGDSPEATQKAKEFYASIIDATITPVSQIKAAEASKILENTFRDVNIAFINEMAKSFYRLGIDTMEVIKGASTKPFAFMPHYPGIGVGGHCIAVDPYYMIEKGKEVGFDHDFLSLARRINSNMPLFTVEVIWDGLNEFKKSLNGAKIAILGLSYKPNVADDRESPTYELIDLLKSKKADIVTYDPHLLVKSSASSLEEAIENADCVVLATAHDEFTRDLSVYKNTKLFIDGRNALDKKYFQDRGISYKGIGISN
jgi:UDP-N-acetyl-D-glucosamine dehydrogenase